MWVREAEVTPRLLLVISTLQLYWFSLISTQMERPSIILTPKDDKYQETSLCRKVQESKTRSISKRDRFFFSIWLSSEPINQCINPKPNTFLLEIALIPAIFTSPERMSLMKITDPVAIWRAVRRTTFSRTWAVLERKILAKKWETKVKTAQERKVEICLNFIGKSSTLKIT